MGVLGCPNDKPHGSIYFTEKEHGSKVICLHTGTAKQLSIEEPDDTSKLVLCTSYENNGMGAGRR